MTIYEIQLKGRLDQHWSAALGGMDLSYDDQDNTLLRGPLADQAALYGVLHRVRDLGVPLLALRIVASNPPPG